MKLIDVSTPKHPNTFAMVDEEDLEKIQGGRWRATKSGRSKALYAVRRTRGVRESMHRMIMATTNQIDHVDMNGLNNQKSNLRAATPAQNCQNRGKPRRGASSKYKGVHWYKARNKYRAQIKTGGKVTDLGLYTDEALAAKAYDVAAKALFGEFARLNFPEVIA